VTSLAHVWLDEAADFEASAWDRLRGELDARHMGAKIRALSHRISLFMCVGNRGFAFSISGCQGAV
jgi:hypothetical protein